MKNLLLQKFNDMNNQVLKYFSSASDIMEAVRGTYPPVSANHSLEEKAEGLWFLASVLYTVMPLGFQIRVGCNRVNWTSIFQVG